MYHAKLLITAEAICDFHTNEFSCYDTGFDPESIMNIFSKIKFSFYRWLVYLSQRCLGFFFSLIFPNRRKREFQKCPLDF